MLPHPRQLATTMPLVSFLALSFALGACAVHYHHPDETSQEPAPSSQAPPKDRPIHRPPPSEPRTEPIRPPSPEPTRPPPPPPKETAPPVRPAPQGRIDISMEPAKPSFLPGESIPVRVVARNTGNATATFYEMRRAFMSFAVVDERGRARTCRREDADHPRQVDAGRFFLLAPGTQLDHSVHLDRFCGELSPGKWTVRLAYHLPPAFDGSAFGLSATTGTFETATSIEIEAPAPQANLALHISRVRRTRADEPFEVTARLWNRGPDAAMVIPPGPGVMRFEVRDQRNKKVTCRLPVGREPRRASLVKLEPNQHLEATIDLAEHCRLVEGRYELVAHYAIQDAHTRPLSLDHAVMVFVDPLTSNRLPFERDAARPRVEVRLDASLPRTVVTEDDPITVVLRAVNEGPDQAVLAVPGIHLVSAHVERERGGRARCSPHAGAARREVTRQVRPGAAAVGQIDLRALCDIDEPGRYEITLTYSVTESSREDTWTGTAVAQPVLLTVSEERRGRPVDRRPDPEPAPEPAPAPEPRPDRQRPARDAGPDLVLEGESSVREGHSIEMNLRFQAGRSALTVGRLAPWMVRWTVQDRYGRRLSCTAPAPPSGRPRQRDFVTLAPREAMALSLDVAEACGIESAGSYFITAQVRVPRSWDGSRLDMDAWTGTLVSEPVTVQVRESRSRRGR